VLRFISWLQIYSFSLKGIFTKIHNLADNDKLWVSYVWMLHVNILLIDLRIFLIKIELVFEKCNDKVVKMLKEY
jgi:hypothetical protein